MRFDRFLLDISTFMDNFRESKCQTPGYCLLKEGKELGENYCQQAIDVMKTLQDYETANHLTSYLDEHGFKL